MITSPAPAPAGYIDAIARAIEAQAINWDDARHLQQAALPTCDPHGRPALGTFNGVKVCELCMTEGRHRT